LHQVVGARGRRFGASRRVAVSRMFRLRGWMCDLFADEGGQDLVEYALLTTVVALASIGGFGLIRTAIFHVYGIWNSGTNSLWQPPDPS
jgi:Flp pilus assembly pilin Flp